MQTYDAAYGRKTLAGEQTEYVSGKPHFRNKEKNRSNTD